MKTAKTLMFAALASLAFAAWAAAPEATPQNAMMQQMQQNMRQIVDAPDKAQRQQLADDWMRTMSSHCQSMMRGKTGGHGPMNGQMSGHHGAMPGRAMMTPPASAAQ